MTFKEKMMVLHERKIKRHKDCPACKSADAMISDNKNKFWHCAKCGYTIAYEKLDNEYIYWFCDECESFLNIQPGFDVAKTSWICQECGFESDITENNIIGQCKDCRERLPNKDDDLCENCRIKRLEKREANLHAAKEIAKALGSKLLETAIETAKKCVKTALSTYTSTIANENFFSKEKQVEAIESATNMALLQLNEETQGYLISTFGNAANWLSDKITEEFDKLK